VPFAKEGLSRYDRWGSVSARRLGELAASIYHLQNLSGLLRNAMNFTHESLCQSIVDHSSVAIMFADQDGIIRLWNGGAEIMFGYSAQEALGQSMDIIIPEKHRPQHWEGYTRVMKTGVTKYGRDVLAVPALTKDRRRISIEFNIALVRDSAGTVLGAAATIQDVTARWEREKATRAQIKELEAKIAQLEKAATGATA
jgi:PAS domain S-box-containing protein